MVGLYIINTCRYVPTKHVAVVGRRPSLSWGGGMNSCKLSHQGGERVLAVHNTIQSTMLHQSSSVRRVSRWQYHSKSLDVSISLCNSRCSSYKDWVGFSSRGLIPSILGLLHVLETFKIAGGFGIHKTVPSVSAAA